MWGKVCGEGKCGGKVCGGGECGGGGRCVGWGGRICVMEGRHGVGEGDVSRREVLDGGRA